MQAPIPFRFNVEDFQDAPDWIGRVFTPLNRFQEQTIQCLDAGIGFGPNIASRQFTTDYSTTSTYLTGTFEPITFSWTNSELPIQVSITKISKVDRSIFYGSVGVPQWVYSNGAIVINYIPGLAASTDYTFTFLVF